MHSSRLFRSLHAITLALACTSLPLTAAPKQEAPCHFENLGRPMKLQPVPIELVSHTPGGETIAWGAVIDPDRFGILGLDVKTGRDLYIDLAKYKRSSSIQFVRGKSGHLYIYAGSPARFFKYSLEKHQLTDLGIPAQPARYITGHAFTDDGVFYIGSYPETLFVGINTATDEIIAAGKISDDQRQKYIIGPIAAADGIVYIPVGLHHAELWAYNPATGKKQQILPESFTAQQGTVSLLRGIDGTVYGQKGELKFRCLPDKVEPLDTLPNPAPTTASRTFEGREYTELDPEGNLVSRHVETGALTHLKTNAQARSILIYSVSTLYNGKLVGGGFIPSRTWAYDIASNTMEDWGKFVIPNTQVYDTLNYKGKLFLSSYSFAHLDFLDPETRKVQRIGSLYDKYGMERVQQLLLGPDNMIYGPTRPAKGYVNGGIVRINPEDLSYDVTTPIIKGLAPTSLVPLKETGELFGTTTTQGGTSAIAIEKEAKIFLWDPKSEKVVWEGVPIPGVQGYSWAVRGNDGLIYGVGEFRYFVFDPTNRKVIHTGEFPFKRGTAIRLARQSAGPDGTIYALVEGAVIGISPKDYRARVVARHPSIMKPFHEALHGTLAVWLSSEGMLYYGSGSELWRVNLAQINEK